MIHPEISPPAYPYNLLLAVIGTTDLELPQKWTADIQAGFAEGRSLIHVPQELRNTLLDQPTTVWSYPPGPITVLSGPTET